ncbi:cyanase [Rhodococcus sp. 05-2256-B2]|uniref:cyanase n=1 Tax=Nocardiaceae TaxID=85025 RepID=UPI00068C780E|nr:MULTISPECIES: cyanase [Rhodococcus]MBY4208139.1 cyanase [Rhodococcus fascians]MBY4382142.1 cyanase [Rhodococcus fascians]MBY4397011.1 cyanase [Rhodococcus fascians]MBY4405831.1 cyanase [Rhodococcus fascians]MBY4421769.1 cyanase [Rhodococcus fascians]
MTGIARTTTAVRLARKRLGLTWKDLAEAIEAPVAWTVAAVYGQHPLTDHQATRLTERLDLSDGALEDLTLAPYRGALDISSDPTVYRFHEALQVYGPALKELIHEEFGDGIMSAINFTVEVTRRPHEDGDRVIVTFDGKFLDYRWTT